MHALAFVRKRLGRYRPEYSRPRFFSFLAPDDQTRGRGDPDSITSDRYEMSQAHAKLSKTGPEPRTP